MKRPTLPVHLNKAIITDTGFYDEASDGNWTRDITTQYPLSPQEKAELLVYVKQLAPTPVTLILHQDKPCEHHFFGGTKLREATASKIIIDEETSTA